MPTSIAKANSVATLEYHYRDHPLVVSRGSPAPRWRDADAQRNQLRVDLPARDGRLAGAFRTV